MWYLLVLRYIRILFVSLIIDIIVVVLYVLFHCNSFLDWLYTFEVDFTLLLHIQEKSIVKIGSFFLLQNVFVVV